MLNELTPFWLTQDVFTLPFFANYELTHIIRLFFSSREKVGRREGANQEKTKAG